jgi:hypothetical protein
VSENQLLARLRKNTAISCAAIALLALALDPQRPRAAIGVLGGGLLIAISYAAVAFTIGAFMPSASPRYGLSPTDALKVAEGPGRPPARRKKAVAALVFASHYALLALAAYVMIARLRLHPIGLLGGVTSIVLAVAAEAVRPVRTR